MNSLILYFYILETNKFYKKSKNEYIYILAGKLCPKNCIFNEDMDDHTFCPLSQKMLLPRKSIPRWESATDSMSPSFENQNM